MSAQRTDRTGRFWTMCPLLRIRRLGVRVPPSAPGHSVSALATRSLALLPAAPDVCPGLSYAQRVVSAKRQIAVQVGATRALLTGLPVAGPGRTGTRWQALTGVRAIAGRRVRGAIDLRGRPACGGRCHGHGGPPRGGGAVWARGGGG